MPASTPGFGTGAIDWSNYVSGNQATTDRDRDLVKQYMQGQDTAARQQAQGAYGQTGYDSGEGQGSQAATDFQGNLAQLYTNQSALQTPEGFQQVLGAANKAGGGQGVPGNAFDAALEGQNAAGLYGGAGDVDKWAQSFAGVPAAAAKPSTGTTAPEPQEPTTGLDTGGSGPGDTKKEGRRTRVPKEP